MALQACADRIASEQVVACRVANLCNMRLPTSAPHARASASGERGGDRLHALHSHIKAPLCATDQVQHSVLASCQHCRQRRQVCAHAKRGGDNDASSDEGDFDDDYYASTGGIFGNIFRSPRNRTGKSKRGHEEKLRADGELFDEEEYHREEPEPNDHKKCAFCIHTVTVNACIACHVRVCCAALDVLQLLSAFVLHTSASP
jgi:hypothetical protein